MKDLALCVTDLTFGFAGTTLTAHFCATHGEKSPKLTYHRRRKA